MEKNVIISNAPEITNGSSGFIKRHSIATYYTLVFVISWGFILAAIGLDAFLGITQMSGAQAPFVYIATLAGPSLAGIIMVTIVNGRTGLKDIQSRLLKWRVGIRWYTVALMTAPILMTAILFALSFTPAIVTSPEKVSLLVSSVIVGLLVPFFEELGWTGFAIPQLRKSYGILATGLIGGLLWGAWHFPLFSGSASASGAIPAALYVAVLLFSWLVAYRVLMVWVYDHTHSLLMMILMHFPIVVAQFVLIPTGISGIPLATFDLAFSAVLWILISAAILSQRHSALKR